MRIDPRPSPVGEPYTVPATNPFVGQAGHRPEIWSYGLRNPWRFSFDRATGDLTIADVGQNAWEEIDFAPASSGGGRGLNFGWKCFEGAHPASNDPPHCSPRPSNHTPPVHEYGHGRGRSITGGYVLRDLGLPALYGRYLYGDALSAPVWSVAASAARPAAGRDAQAEADLPRAPGDRTAAGEGAGTGTARQLLRGAASLRALGTSAGRVVSQSPRPRSRRLRGTRVHLTVSRGRR